MSGWLCDYVAPTIRTFDVVVVSMEGSPVNRSDMSSPVAQSLQPLFPAYLTRSVESKERDRWSSGLASGHGGQSGLSVPDVDLMMPVKGQGGNGGSQANVAIGIALRSHDLTSPDRSLKPTETLRVTQDHRSLTMNKLPVPDAERHPESRQQQKSSWKDRLSVNQNDASSSKEDVFVLLSFSPSKKDNRASDEQDALKVGETAAGHGICVIPLKRLVARRPTGWIPIDSLPPNMVTWAMGLLERLFLEAHEQTLYNVCQGLAKGSQFCFPPDARNLFPVFDPPRLQMAASQFVSRLSIGTIDRSAVPSHPTNPLRADEYLASEVYKVAGLPSGAPIPTGGCFCLLPKLDDKKTFRDRHLLEPRSPIPLPEVVSDVVVPVPASTPKEPESRFSLFLASKPLGQASSTHQASVVPNKARGVVHVDELEMQMLQESEPSHIVAPTRSSQPANLSAEHVRDSLEMVLASRSDGESEDQQICCIGAQATRRAWWRSLFRCCASAIH